MVTDTDSDCHEGHFHRRSFTNATIIYNNTAYQSIGATQRWRSGVDTGILTADANLIAFFVRNNNIFLVDLLHDKAECQVTMDGKFNEVINGNPRLGYEEEFSTNSSMVFSADSRQIAAGFVMMRVPSYSIRCTSIQGTET